MKRYIYHAYDAEPGKDNSATAIALHYENCPVFKRMEQKGYVSVPQSIEDARRRALDATEFFDSEGITVVNPKCDLCEGSVPHGPKPYLLDALTR